MMGREVDEKQASPEEILDSRLDHFDDGPKPVAPELYQAIINQLRGWFHDLLICRWQISEINSNDAENCRNTSSPPPRKGTNASYLFEFLFVPDLKI